MNKFSLKGYFKVLILQYMARNVSENSHRIFSETLLHSKLNCEWFFGFVLLELQILYAMVPDVSKE
jgi:hypothetical protein